MSFERHKWSVEAPPLIWFTLLVAYNVSSFASAQLRFDGSAPIPTKFHDNLLPALQTNGELIPGLGRVMLLDTLLAPNHQNALETIFYIHNNRRGHSNMVKKIRFNVDSYATLGRQHVNHKTHYGPYQYELDLLLQSGFDINRRTIVMIPGYLSGEEVLWMSAARNEWLRLDSDANVIEVTWSDSNHGTYSRAVARTPLVARQVTVFLYYLAALSGVDFRDEHFLKRVHLIGHSLGAHISGFVGQDLGGRVGRITGLDPAGPSFDTYRAEQRLDRSDALLVDVLHTNAGRIKYLNALASAPLHALSKLPVAKELGKSIGSSYNGGGDTAWFGIEKNIGHIDYYANDGRVQAGCAGLLHLCDHERANLIYVDLLKYETRLRQLHQPLVDMEMDIQPGDNEERARRLNALSKRHRLLAFKAPDYDSFISGHNLLDSCAALMSAPSHLNTHKVAKTFRHCTVPLLDLVTPLDELRHELAHKYKIDLSANSKKHHVYYFKTAQDGKLLVGDHYLLKIYLQGEPVWDEKQCALETTIQMDDGRRLSLGLNKIVHPSKSSNTLAIPFVHLDGAEARYRLNRLLDLLYSSDGEEDLDDDDDDDEDDDNDANSCTSCESDSDCDDPEYRRRIPYSASSNSLAQDAAAAAANVRSRARSGGDTFNEMFEMLFPKTITLALVRPKSTSVFGTMKDMTIKMIKTSDTTPACELAVNMIEVHPINGPLNGQPNVAGIYGRNLFIGPDLKLITVSDQMKLLTNQEKTETRLGPKEFRSFSVGLEGAIRG